MNLFRPPEPPPGERLCLAGERPLRLDCGVELREVDVAYCSYGRLNDDRSNVILVVHGLTGDQVAAGAHPVTGRPGWWERMIGPGRPLDTERYFVLCANVLGGCMGTLGPASTNPATGEPYGPDFPPITIADMVRCQARLLDGLGIETLLSVIGGSMGGMQALQWLKDYPERVASIAPLAAGPRHSAQQIALHAIGREAIAADADWRGGRYYDTGRSPERGLKTARMLAHLTYRSPGELAARFGRALCDAPDKDGLFEVESYLAYHGRRFVERFDANSYMTITRAMDRFDLGSSETLDRAFSSSTAPAFLAAYETDWLYPPSEMREVAEALERTGHPVTFEVYASLQGHDSFLLDIPEQDAALTRFLCDCAARGEVAAPA